MPERINWGVAQPTDPLESPRVRVEQVESGRRGRDARWHTTWQLTNEGDFPLSPRGIWLPHGRFRMAEESLDASALVPGARRTITTRVAFNEPPGAAVENAFLILRVALGDQPWRIFVRLVVWADETGAPVARVELVTSQRAGLTSGFVEAPPSS